MPDAKFISAVDVVDSWWDDWLNGTAPITYPVGMEAVQLGPGTVTLLGGAPGAGKTALAVQWIIDALRLTPDLRAVICNVEMTPAALLERQIARLSGVDLTSIRQRKRTPEHTDRIDLARANLEEPRERLCFVRPPFDLANIAATADAFSANLILLDYVQRIAPPGTHGDKRGSVDAMMSFLRQFADQGLAIIAVAAVGRTKDSRGRSSYDTNGLGLASFKESGEIEYGADTAFMLSPDPKLESNVTLRCLKNRNGEPADTPLHFDRAHQRFTLVTTNTPPPAKSMPSADLAALWDRTPPAP